MSMIRTIAVLYGVYRLYRWSHSPYQPKRRPYRAPDNSHKVYEL
jgi:hypothetical protein